MSSYSSGDSAAVERPVEAVELRADDESLGVRHGLDVGDDPRHPAGVRDRAGRARGPVQVPGHREQAVADRGQRGVVVEPRAARQDRAGLRRDRHRQRRALRVQDLRELGGEGRQHRPQRGCSGLEVDVDAVVSVLGHERRDARDQVGAIARRSRAGSQDQRVLRLHARLERDAAHARPVGDQRVVLALDREVAAERVVGGRDDRDLAVVALEVLEAAVGRGEQVGVGRPGRRERCERGGVECAVRGAVAGAVDRRDA